MLIEKSLLKADERGFGAHLPFGFISRSYPVQVKVVNSYDVFNPINF